MRYRFLPFPCLRLVRSGTASGGSRILSARHSTLVLARQDSLRGLQRHRDDLPAFDRYLAMIDGKRDRMVGKIRERYGITKEKAEEQIRDWDFTARNEKEMVRRKAS